METDRAELVRLLGYNGGDLDRQLAAWRGQVPGPRLDAIVAGIDGREVRNPRAYIDRCVREIAQEMAAAPKPEAGAGDDVLARARKRLRGEPA
jgi:hypothetical protein